jgi:flavin reductase (DIM6/NTAB) family NADH-FMN oxidoreductase RutF
LLLWYDRRNEKLYYSPQNTKLEEDAMKFIEVSPEAITDNTFKLIGKDWMLVTVGTDTSFNTMTAAWGGLGVLWDKNICFCVIRPTRYTFAFMEKSEGFTLAFFEERYRDTLTYCGTKSGKDVDKIAETGLTPVFDNGAVYFSEARLVMVCRKLYTQDIVPANFLDPGIDKFYPKKDYHRMYVGEISRCLRK